MQLIILSCRCCPEKRSRDRWLTIRFDTANSFAKWHEEDKDDYPKEDLWDAFEELKYMWIVELEDEYESIGARIVQQVASKTSDVAGDGTTTATVLAESILDEGLRGLAAGIAPIAMKTGMDKAVKAVTDRLAELSRPIESNDDLRHIAAISANNDKEIGDIIAAAMERVGRDGVITVEDSSTAETTVDLVEGIQFDRGYISPHFATGDSLTADLEEPYLLIADKKISTYKDLSTALEIVMDASKPLLIVAEDVEGEALAVLVLNKLKGTFKSVAVKAPGSVDGSAPVKDPRFPDTDPVELSSKDLMASSKSISVAEHGSESGSSGGLRSTRKK